jgi:hypothetical protein
MSSANKRDSFRINEDVHFEFKPVSASFAEEEDVERAFEHTDNSLHLIDQLNKIDRDVSQSLKLISDKNRLLGDYLQSINKKIDVIGRHVVFNSEESLNNRPLKRISLSEDGIGFITDRSLYKGSIIALRLIFLPNYYMAMSYSEVLRCVQHDDKYQIAAKFKGISDKDRQVISRQVLRAQMQDRKKQPK